MPVLILLRHGQSTYNAEGKFTGTTDVPLTELGREQAAQAASQLINMTIDMAFSSERLRAKETLEIVLNKLGVNPPVKEAHELNEQDFGDLEGVEKNKAEKLYGTEKVLEWRRAFNGYPPKGERFIAVQTRVAEFYKEQVEPLLKEGNNILLVAHSNSLRALAVYLLDLDLREIPTFEFGNAEPYCLAFSDQLKLVNAHTLL